MAIIVHIRRKEESKGSTWFDNLTPDQQAEYIEEHPNSQYAKNAHKVSDKDIKVKNKQRTSSPTVKSVFGDKLKHVPKEHAEFFEREQDKPNSEERRGIAKHIRTNSKEIVKHMKGQIAEWGDGCNAIGKLASGKKISDHEKKALKALVIDAAVIAGSIAITGGFAHGAALAMKHIGFDVLKDVVLKTVIRGTSKAMGASATHTGLMAGLEAIASTSSIAVATKTKQDKLNDKILHMLVEQMAKLMEKGDIPEDAWEKALDELSKKKPSKKR